MASRRKAPLEGGANFRRKEVGGALIDPSGQRVEHHMKSVWLLVDAIWALCIFLFYPITTSGFIWTGNISHSFQLQRSGNSKEPEQTVCRRCKNRR